MKQSNAWLMILFGKKFSYVLAASFFLCLFFVTPVHAGKKMKTTVTNDEQVPARFPGGERVWNKYLERNFDKSVLVKNGAPLGKYSVTVSFIVGVDGNVSDVTAENDPGYGAKEEALKVIQRGPKWIPAELDGKKVIYRHKQKIEVEIK